MIIVVPKHTYWVIIRSKVGACRDTTSGEYRVTTFSGFYEIASDGTKDKNKQHTDGIEDKEINTRNKRIGQHKRGG